MLYATTQVNMFTPYNMNQIGWRHWLKFKLYQEKVEQVLTNWKLRFICRSDQVTSLSFQVVHGCLNQPATPTVHSCPPCKPINPLLSQLAYFPAADAEAPTDQIDAVDRRRGPRAPLRRSPGRDLVAPAPTAPALLVPRRRGRPRRRAASAGAHRRSWARRARPLLPPHQIR